MAMNFNGFILKSFRFNRFNLNHRSASTIFAVSSGRGKCGVAVIRVSGSQAGNALKTMTRMSTLPKARHALLRSIKSTQDEEEVIDKGLILWFPGPFSFTGEDVCEFQVHGGSAVVAATLNSLSTIPNLRMAEPGEFTRRAFYNSKLDLTEVEGIADLLSAETEVQRKQAFLQTQGSLSKLYSGWKKVLVQCLANIEAHIDFEETENLDTNLLENVARVVAELRREIEKHLNDGRKGERLRNGVKTVILGEPNVGKSSLLNALCQRPAAIVTPIEGTTRDVLETTLDVNGYPLVLMDTAGLRSNIRDVIEKEGINRALIAYKESDLILLVIDCLKYLQWRRENGKSFKRFLEDYLHKLNIGDLINSLSNPSEIQFNKPCLIIVNKIDLVEKEEVKEFEDLNVNVISCKSEEGISAMLQKVTSELSCLCGEPSEEHPSMNQMRHREYLTKCLNCLQLFIKKTETSDVVLMTEELRKALRQLGKITGAVTTEQLLDVIFKEFCIGK